MASSSPSSTISCAVRISRSNETIRKFCCAQNLMEVFIDLQVMLRIASQCVDNAPSVVVGELIGLEVSPGNLEISNCFVNPANRTDSIAAQDESTDPQERQKREIEKHRVKVRELLHYVDSDCQSVGFFCTITHRAIHDPALVDELYHRVSDVDKASIILGFDLQRNSTGKFPFRGFRLSDEYLAIRIQSDPKVNGTTQPKQLGSGICVLTEIPVHPRGSVADRLLLLNMQPSVSERVQKTYTTALTASHDIQIALEDLAETMSIYTAFGEKLSRNQNLKYARRGKKIEAAANRRGWAPATEAADDEEFKGDAPYQLKTLMMTNQVQSIASNIQRAARENVAATALIRPIG